MHVSAGLAKLVARSDGTGVLPILISQTLVIHNYIVDEATIIYRQFREFDLNSICSHLMNLLWSKFGNYNN